MIKTIELDDQNFDMIVENARKAIRKYAPDWTDENAHDPGITLIELFAWLKEMQQFYMDQTTEPIETQFLKLLGQHRRIGQPSRLTAQWVIQDCEVNLYEKTRASKGRFDFETITNTRLEPIKISDISVNYEGEKRSVYALIDSGLTLYPFGPEGQLGSSFYVAFDRPLPEGQEQMFYLKLSDLEGIKRTPIQASGSFYPLSEVQWSGTFDGIHWEPLVLKRDDTYGMIQSGCFVLDFPAGICEGRGCLEIKATLNRSEFDFPPRIADFYNRVVEFRQVRSYDGPELLYGSTGLPYQTIALPYEDIVESSLVVETLEKQADGSKKWMLWSQVESERLDASNEDDHWYCLESNGQQLRFGNGRHGKIPEKGKQVIRLSAFERSYFDQGNISLDCIETASESAPLIFKCLTQASGGMKAETLEDLRLSLLKSLHQAEVAVTAKDYEDMLSAVPGLAIKKVKCLPLYKPGLVGYPEQTAPNTVSVFVIPHGPKRLNVLNAAYMKNLKDFIEKRRLVTTEVHLLDPVYYEVSVYCEVTSSRQGEAAVVSSRAALEAMNHYEFGQPVTKSLVYQVLSQCTEIDHIQSITLSCMKPVNKNRLGDLLIPANGIAFLSAIEIVLISE